MNLTTELLVPSRQADLRREASTRALGALVDRCRTWILGVLPVSRPCEASCT